MTMLAPRLIRCLTRFLTHRGVNALAESIIGLFKTEVIHRKGPWRHLEGVEFAALDCVDWFNNRRLLEPIGYVPPAEYEAQYYALASQGGARRHPDPDS